MPTQRRSRYGRVSGYGVIGARDSRGKRFLHEWLHDKPFRRFTRRRNVVRFMFPLIFPCTGGSVGEDVSNY
jgi:hypothetical protein